MTWLDTRVADALANRIFGGPNRISIDWTVELTQVELSADGAFDEATGVVTPGATLPRTVNATPTLRMKREFVERGIAPNASAYIIVQTRGLHPDFITAIDSEHPQVGALVDPVKGTRWRAVGVDPIQPGDTIVAYRIFLAAA